MMKTEPLITSPIAEKFNFFQKFIQSPGLIGSITPSSRFLTNKMMEPINWEMVQSIAELGAGTGVFTDAINLLKTAECQVMIFEQNTEMRHQLKQKYPKFTFGKDAQQLSTILNSHGISKLDCIVSGLPFANFPQDIRDSILNEVIESLDDDGLFITFQYSLQMNQQLKSLFKSVQKTFVPLNVPPAFVYVCQK